MFSNEDLKCLDPEYFNIITTDAYDVTIMSRNTGHYWYLHNPEYPERGTVIIFHKHKASLQTATFCGQQGRISRTVRAILNGQPGRSAGQRVLRPTDQY